MFLWIVIIDEQRHKSGRLYIFSQNVYYLCASFNDKKQNHDWSGEGLIIY